MLSISPSRSVAVSLSRPRVPSFTLPSFAHLLARSLSHSLIPASSCSVLLFSHSPILSSPIFSFSSYSLMIILFIQLIYCTYLHTYNTYTTIHPCHHLPTGCSPVAQMIDPLSQRARAKFSWQPLSALCRPSRPSCPTRSTRSVNQLNE